MDSIEQQLVDRFRNGDEEAFEAIYSRMADPIYRFAYGLLGSADDAEDVAVQTFALAHKGRTRFRGHSSVETWLFRIAVNVARRHAQGRKPRIPIDDQVADQGQADDLTRVEIDQLILGLPPGLRSAFLLVKLEGLKYREAAEVLGKRTGTIQNDVHEACKRLREQTFLKDTKPVRCEEKFGYEL